MLYALNKSCMFGVLGNVSCTLLGMMLLLLLQAGRMLGDLVAHSTLSAKQAEGIVLSTAAMIAVLMKS